METKTLIGCAVTAQLSALLFSHIQKAGFLMMWLISDQNSACILYQNMHCMAVSLLYRILLHRSYSSYLCNHPSFTHMLYSTKSTWHSQPLFVVYTSYIFIFIAFTLDESVIDVLHFQMKIIYQSHDLGSIIKWINVNAIQ